MEENNRHSLMLSGVDVTVTVEATTVARLRCLLTSNVVADADVICVYITENDYRNGQQPPIHTARAIVNMALS